MQFFACLFVIFAAQVAVGVVGYMKRDEINGWWNQTVTGFVSTYGQENATLQTSAMDAMQKGFKCCGANAPGDYVISASLYPWTCCDKPETVMLNVSLGNVPNALSTTTTATPKKAQEGCPIMNFQPPKPERDPAYYSDVSLHYYII